MVRGDFVDGDQTHEEWIKRWSKFCLLNSKDFFQIKAQSYLQDWPQRRGLASNPLFKV